MKFKFKALCILLVAGIVLIASCRKGQSGWSTDLLVPIASSTLSLQNIVKDTSLKVNADNSLTLAYQSSLYQFNLADQIIKIPDTAIGQKFTLDSLVLPSPHINYGISLGTLAINLLASSNAQDRFFGNFLIANNQSSTIVPPVSGISPGSFQYDASAFYDSAILVSGQVEIWVVNNLPITLDRGALITLSNGSTGAVIQQYTTTDTVRPHDSIFFVIHVTPGVKITNQLTFNISNLSTPGSYGNNVPIDTADNIAVHMFIAYLHVSEAWAKFPNQNVVDITEDVTQNIGERRFTYIDARSGFLHIYITNSVQEKLYLEYTLVGAYDNYGHALKEFTTVPAAPPGGTITIDTLLNITGYSINLTGKTGANFNTYTQRIVARIDSSGNTAHITLADSLHIKYELKDIAPNYIKGYAGKDTVISTDSADFAFLNMFKGGTIDLEDVTMKVNIENGVGVDGQIKINSLTAISPNNGQKNLTGSILGKPLVVNRATDFPLTPSVSNFVVDRNNSNIKDLIGILPNKLKYNLEVRTNVNGNNRQYRDFAYLQSSLKLNLNAEIPLSLIANHLLLRDTINFSLGGANTNVGGITDGTINLITENKYPIEAKLSMIVYDSIWNVVDTLIANQTVQAAALDNNCRAQQPQKTKIPEYVDQGRMDRLKLGKHAVVIADFSTASNNALCNGQHLKIYSDYTLGITLTAHFNYRIKTHF